MESRKDLRNKILAARDSLSERERQEKSKVIEENVLALEEVARAGTVFVYVDFRSEVKTANLIARLMSGGKSVSVPITHVTQKKMDAIHIDDVELDLQSGYCGIPEPRKELLASNITDPHSIDVVILPGSVFDNRGGRMGYGGGYYDRFLEKIPSAVRIGLAFEVQKVDRVPLEPHDELLDYVVTEKDTIRLTRM